MPRSYFALHGVMGWCNVTLAASAIYLYLGVPLAMREYGWSGTEIGLFQASGLPVVLKFLMASPVDKFRFAQDNYLKWSALLCIGFVVCLWALAGVDIRFQSLFLIALGMTLVSTWLDVPINAFVLQRLPESERGKSGAIRSAVTALASVIGGGLMLLVYDSWGWQWPFYSFMIMTGVGVLAMYWAYCRYPVQCYKPQQSTDVPSLWGMWCSYFQRPNQFAWNVILILHFPFIGAAWLYLKPTLLDFGLTVSEIAWLSAWAGLVAAFAGFCYSQTLKHWSLSRALSAFSLVNTIALFGMYGISVMRWHDWRLIAVVMSVAIALGLSSAVLFAGMMRQCRSELAASDYGIQSSLFSLSRIVVPISAGVLLDRLGFSGMYLGLACCALLVSLVCCFVFEERNKHISVASRG